MSQKYSLKKQFINDGLRLAEIDSFLRRELAQDGYVNVKMTSSADTKVFLIFCTQIKDNDEARRTRELIALIAARFSFDPSTLKCFFGKVTQRGLSASAQCEAIKHRLLTGLAVRQAAYSVLRTVMDAGARGCEVVISGKVRGQRAKAMKFVDGVMIHAGQAASEHVEQAVRHVYTRQGILGVRVTINKSQDPSVAPTTVSTMLPDHVFVLQPKEEEILPHDLPFSTNLKGEIIQCDDDLKRTEVSEVPNVAEPIPNAQSVQ